MEGESDLLRRRVEVVRFVVLMRSSDAASGLLRLPAGASVQIVPEACSHRGCLEVGWELARALEDSDDGDGLLLATALPESVHLIRAAKDDGLRITLVAPCIDALTPAILAADRFLNAQALHRPP
jgi:hypothetical protein